MPGKWGEIQGKWELVRVIGVLLSYYISTEIKREFNIVKQKGDSIRASTCFPAKETK